MKTRKLLLLILAMTYWSYSFAQKDTVYYEILRNDPININNLFIYAKPISIDYLTSYINLTYGFGLEYNHKDKFILGFDFKRSYSEKLNNYFQGYDNKSIFNFPKTGYAINGEKNLTNYEFSAQYLLLGRLVEHTEKPVMHEGISKTTYIKIKDKHYLSLALRTSYGYLQYNLNNLSFGNTERDFYFKAYKINNPSDIIEDIDGATMYYMHFVSFGFGVLQKQDLAIKTIKYNTKDISMTTNFYFDILLPVSQELDNMHIRDNSNSSTIYYEVNVNDYTNLNNYGFRIGMDYKSCSKLRKINGASKVEIGFFPGPGKLSHNLFISLSIALNISFNTLK